MRFAWTPEEKDYLMERVLDDKVHPYVVWKEMLKRFGKDRTYMSIKSWLKNNDICYRGLIKKSDIEAARKSVK